MRTRVVSKGCYCWLFSWHELLACRSIVDGRHCPHNFSVTDDLPANQRSKLSPHYRGLCARA